MKISVCMATYNGEKYISEQVGSILKQIGKDDELIISDDHSTDNTIKVIEEYKDSRIRILMNNGDKGYTKNFENAIKNASGDIIFLSDQDDVWIEGKVQKMVKKLENADIVISNAQVVDTNLKTIHTSHFDLNNVKKGFWINFFKTRYCGACMAFKKEILVKLLPFPKNQTYCVHDYWIALICEAYYKVELEETPLIKYRRHGENATTAGVKSTRPFRDRIFARVYTLINVLRRFNIN